jgi:hypothetical protein
MARHRGGLHPRDLALAGQEHQQVTRMRGQRLLHRAARLQFQRLVAARGKWLIATG